MQVLRRRRALRPHLHATCRLPAMRRGESIVQHHGWHTQALLLSREANKFTFADRHHESADSYAARSLKFSKICDSDSQNDTLWNVAGLCELAAGFCCEHLLHTLPTPRVTTLTS
jgi:hypothetical protein